MESHTKIFLFTILDMCFTVVATNENKEKMKKNMENFGVKSEI